MLMLISEDGNRYILDRNGQWIIGSGPADIIIPALQPKHLILIKARDNIQVKPVGGDIKVNGTPITNITRLVLGDQLDMNGIVLVLEHESATPTATPPSLVTSQPSSNRIVPNNPFSLSDTLMNEPANQLPSSPPSASATSSVPVTPNPTRQPAPIVPSQPSIAPQNAPQQPSNRLIEDPLRHQIRHQLTSDQCREILRRYFEDAQIYKETKNGNITFNLVDRWRRTNSVFGRSWVLATEGLKAGIKLMQWLSDQQRANNVSDSVFVDDAIHTTIYNLVNEAHHQLAIYDADLIADPLIIHGPIFWLVSGIPVENICAREGDDGFMRFSARKVSILLLTDEDIGIYSCHLDTITGRVGSFSIDNYMYQDIVSITTKDTEIEVDMDNERRRITVHAFKLVVSNDELVVTLNSPEIRKTFQGDMREELSHERTIKAIRQIWRSKKRTT